MPGLVKTLDNSGMKHMLSQQAWALIQNNPGALFIDVRLAVALRCGLSAWCFDGLPRMQS